MSFQNSVVLEVPKTFPRCDDSFTRGLMEVSIQLYPCLRFITVKECKAKSTRGKGTWYQIWKK